MKSFKALLVLALVLGIAAPAYAETQNVKVSGSIDAYAFWRENYDLRDNNDASVIPVGGTVPNNSHGNTGDTIATGSNIARSLSVLGGHEPVGQTLLRSCESQERRSFSTTTARRSLLRLSSLRVEGAAAPPPRTN